MSSPMLPAPNKFPIQKADRNRYYREVQKVRTEFPYTSVYGKINPYNKRKILSENDYDLYCHSYAVLRLYEKSLAKVECQAAQSHMAAEHIRSEAYRVRSGAYQYVACARKYVLRQRILSAVLAVVAAIAIGFSAFSRRSVPADSQPVSAQPSVSQAAAAPSAAPAESPSVAKPAPAVEQPTQTPPASSPSYTASSGSSRPDPYISDSYIGNRSSHKFHRSTCSFLPNPENQVIFDSASDALAAGYEPCKKCNP